MPGVDVYFDPSVYEKIGRVTAHTEKSFHEVNARIYSSIKTSVRRFGTTHFSVEGKLILSDRDFSFKFHALEQGDELTNDIIVRIRLHAFKERLDHLDDAISAEMARYIVEDLAKFFLIREEVTVGIELMLAEIMWGTASTLD